MSHSPEQDSSLKLEANYQTDLSPFSADWLLQLMHDVRQHESMHELPGGVEAELSSFGQQAHDLLARFSCILSAHHDTPPAVLTWLAKFDDHKLLERIAEHPTTPRETLECLAQSPYPDVRGAVGDNPNASRELLNALARDLDPDVRHHLAENCNMHKDILETLCEDENPYIACRAARSLGCIQQSSQPKTTQKLSILLVDDDDVTRLILSLALKTDTNLRVIGTATSGATAIQMARTLQPDVILMDIGMPHMNGIVATSLIKKELPNIKVIMVTASDRLEEIVGAFGHGAEGYHLKSSTRHDLCKAIHAVASGSFWLDPGIVSTVLRELTKQSMPIVQRNYDAVHHAQLRLTDPVQALMKIVDEYANKKLLLEARQICQNAVNLSQEMYGDSATTTAALNRLADLYFLDQEYSTSEATYLNLIRLQSRLCNLDDPSLDHYLGFLSDLYEFRGNTEQAELFAAWHLRVCENLGEPVKLTEARDRMNHILESKTKHLQS